jgi:hypothetical protein
MIRPRHRTSTLSHQTLDSGKPPAAVRRLGLGIGAGRIGLGAAFMAMPVQSVRFLGVDTATATRLDWLARMTAGRDMAIGAGTVLSSLTGRGTRTWLLAGAACDAVDALAVGGALKQKRVSLLPAVGTVVVAGAATAAAVAAATRRF